MKTIFLNIRTSQGVETVDEFTREEEQDLREFRLYVTQMIKEYQITGINVYKSSRCTSDWKQK